MGFLAGLHEARSYNLPPLTLKSREIAKYFGAQPVSSGVSVNEDTALNYAAVWAAVSLISSDVASLPLILYQRLATGGKTRADQLKLYRILKDEPNPEMSSMVFRETLQGHVLTYGNGYAEIVRDGAGRVTALWPITPNRVTPFRNGRGALMYRVAASYEEPGPANPGDDFDASEILHIPGLGYDGVCGYSVVTRARESIGLGVATEKFGATFFGNGASFGGVFEHPNRMSELARKNFSETLEARHQGVERAHKFLIVEEGMKYQRLGIPPEDAQFLETRKFQVDEIARWFRLPPHKIGSMERATFSNIEQQDLEYYKSCLRAWLVRWEQEINRKLIPSSERNIQFAEHLIDGLLRGDIQTRFNAYAVARQWGWYSADDVLEKENGNPLPNGQGQIYLVPQNMWPADKLEQMVTAQSQPAPAPTPDMGGSNLARSIDLLTERLIRADTSIDEMKALIKAWETRLVIVADDQTAQNELRAAIAVEQQQLAQVMALRDEMAVERDTLRNALAQEQIARDAREQQAIQERAAHLQAMADGATAQQNLQAALEIEQQQVVSAHIVRDEIAQERDRLADALVQEEIARRDAERQVLEQRVVIEHAEGKVALSMTEAATARERAEQAEAAGAKTARMAMEIQEQLTALRTAGEAGIARQIQANCGLFEDVLRRMIERETDRGRRAQSTPEKLRTWIKTFYEGHGDLMCVALLPAMRVHLAFIRSTSDPLEDTRILVQGHILDSMRQLLVMLDGDADDLAASLSALWHRWEQERPAMIANAMMQVELDYARRRS